MVFKSPNIFNDNSNFVFCILYLYLYIFFWPGKPVEGWIEDSEGRWNGAPALKRHVDDDDDDDDDDDYDVDVAVGDDDEITVPSLWWL